MKGRSEEVIFHLLSNEVMVDKSRSSVVSELEKCRYPNTCVTEVVIFLVHVQCVEERVVFQSLHTE